MTRSEATILRRAAQKLCRAAREAEGAAADLARVSQALPVDPAAVVSIHEQGEVMVELCGDYLAGVNRELLDRLPPRALIALGRIAAARERLARELENIHR